MGEGLAKQAKTLTDKQIKRALAEVATHRYPERDRVMVLLSVKGGLRAKEIAMVTWGMVTDAEGNVGDALHLLNGASKGKKGGRTVPLNSALHDADPGRRHAPCRIDVDPDVAAACGCRFQGMGHFHSRLALIGEVLGWIPHELPLRCAVEGGGGRSSLGSTAQPRN